MSARSYWIGLPVGVTVHDDGTVEVEVDMSEASGGARDEWYEADEETNPEVAAYTEAQVLADGAVVDAHPGPWKVRAPAKVTEMRCPARYTCSFRTFSKSSMIAHLEDAAETHEA